MKYAISAATGHFGQIAIRELLKEVSAVTLSPLSATLTKPRRFYQQGSRSVKPTILTRTH